MAARIKRGNGSIRFDKKANCYVGRLSVLVNGKRERPSITGKTFTECGNALRRLQHKIESGDTMASRDRETVAVYIANWLDVSNLASSTLTRYRSLATKVFTHAWFADLKMYEVAPTHVLKLYKSMAPESDSTRKKVHVLLHTTFEDARHLRRIAFNPCDIPKKQKPKYDRPDVHPFDERQEAAFLAAIRGDENEAMYLLPLDSGARQGELWALEWNDVDLKAGVIRVRQTLKDDGGHLVIGPTKGKTERSLTIAPSTLAALRALRKLDLSQELVFPNESGGYIRRQNFNRRDWARIMRKAGLSGMGFTFHDLRHSCATMLLRNGETIANVSKRLGHSKISTTLDYYAHALPQDDARPAHAFEERLRRYGA
jgi:integrase